MDHEMMESDARNVPSHAGIPGSSGGGSTPRRAWRWAGLALVLAAAIAGAAVWPRLNAARAPVLQGAVLTQPATAYDFSLPDADGHVVSLSAFRGKVVALTFLYANCPDVCPLVAEQFRAVHGQLGDTARHAAFVAISVDPAGDTPAAVRQFLRTHRVEGTLTYLRGTAAQLQPVWARYFVASDAGTAKATPLPGQVGHTSIVYVIDPHGQIRVFLPANFDSKDLLTDMRALAPRAGR